jgi:poly(3-hydroxybutyrate) depolymerase
MWTIQRQAACHGALLPTRELREARVMRSGLSAAYAAAVTVLLCGCAVTQPQNTPVSHRAEIDPSTGRLYYIYVPSTYRHERPAPVIVSCHGTPPYDVAGHHIREWKMLGEENGCIVVAPTLIGTDGLVGDGPIVGMLECERSILSILSLLGYRYNIDRANIMISGFSGGGFPTYWVGLRNPDVFSVVVARNCNFNEGNLHGWYPQDALLSDVMVYYGENDPGAIVAQSKSAIRYLQSHGFKVETAVIPGKGHERHPEVAMRFFRDHFRVPRPSMREGLARLR